MQQIVAILAHSHSPNSVPHHIRASGKRLTHSDVRNLSLSKTDVESIILPHLNAPQEQIQKGVDVIVYGPDGGPSPLTFKRWGSSAYVLIGGWGAFYQKQGFRMNDYVTLWLFRHRHPTTNLLRFAITARPQPHN